MKSQSIYEAAHKGDFDYIRSKVEEDYKLLLVTDSVGIKCLPIKIFFSTIYVISIYIT